MIKKLPTVVLTALLAAPAFGATVVSFNFQELNAAVPSVTTDPAGSNVYGSLLDSNLEHVTVSLGAGLSPAAYSNSFAAKKGSSPAYVDLASAKAADGFFTFTVAPVAGQQIDFESIDIKVAFQDGGTFALLSSMDGFDAPLAVMVDPPKTNETFNIDLSSLPVTSAATEFRLFSYGGGSAYAQRGIGNAFVGGDTGADLVISGTLSAVPEPAHFAALAGLLVLAGAVARRRRRV